MLTIAALTQSKHVLNSKTANWDEKKHNILSQIDNNENQPEHIFSSALADMYARYCDWCHSKVV